MKTIHDKIDINHLIEKLSDNYPHIDFILTEKSNIVKNNVLHTSDIIMTSGCDLNEISYLSTKCDIIVGRASGPYCFTHVKENMLNTNKIPNIRDLFTIFIKIEEN